MSDTPGSANASASQPAPDSDTPAGYLTPEEQKRRDAQDKQADVGLNQNLANQYRKRAAQDDAATLTVLGRAGRELFATAEKPRLDVPAAGLRKWPGRAVLACYVPASGQVFLRPARADALGEDLVNELPEGFPGEGLALSVPESDLRRAIDGAPARRDLRRVLDIVALPRIGGGQLTAGYREGVRTYRQTGDSCCTFYDTDRERYVFTEEPGYERYVNVAQGRPGHPRQQGIRAAGPVGGPALEPERLLFNAENRFGITLCRGGSNDRLIQAVQVEVRRVSQRGQGFCRR
jgi:hypothetical protein